MKTAEKKLLKLVKVVIKKQAVDPRVPGCAFFYHQPRRPKRVS